MGCVELHLLSQLFRYEPVGTTCPTCRWEDSPLNNPSPGCRSICRHAYNGVILPLGLHCKMKKHKSSVNYRQFRYFLHIIRNSKISKKIQIFWTIGNFKILGTMLWINIRNSEISDKNVRKNIGVSEICGKYLKVVPVNFEIFDKNLTFFKIFDKSVKFLVLLCRFWNLHKICVF